jgi:probable rRNA maturation factor
MFADSTLHPKAQIGWQGENSVLLRNRQRIRKIDLRLLRRILLVCLRELLAMEHFEVGIEIVDSARMTELNEGFLRHAGSTDVISFDYGGKPLPGRVLGDIYICIDEAICQAKRFRATWQEELVRYSVHGILHLLGYDDRTARLREKMKRVEDKLVAALAARFPVKSLHRRSRPSHG